MKTALCCIAKLENNYIREFLNHYRELGIDHVYIYDNNDSNSENIRTNIGDFLFYNYVTIIDFRDKKECQLEAYEHCYNTYGKYYDWMAFFDCDEFLEMVDFSNINEFLNQEKFKDKDKVVINWVCYGDNENVRYDNRLLSERFSKPIHPLNFYGHGYYDYITNSHIKTIMRTNLSNLIWGDNPHYLVHNTNISACNYDGKPCTPNFSVIHNYNFDKVYLKHYVTKTIEEYVTIKMKRGYPDANYVKAEKMITLGKFFKYNKWTEEKEKFGKQLINELRKPKNVVHLV